MEDDILVGDDEVLYSQLSSMKGSPSHESDSGLSDMTEDGSVSPTLGENLVDIESVFDVDLLPSFGIDTDLDNDLANYLKSSDIDNVGPTVQVVSCQTTMEDRQLVKQISSSDSMCEDNFDADESENASDIVINLNKNISRVIQPKIQVPESNLKTVAPSRNTLPNPAIKMVRIVKTPVASTRSSSTCNAVVDSNQMDALEDKSRKNAVQAKINREKKKMYIKSLEDEIDNLRQENSVLKDNSSKMDEEKEQLLEEITYLKSVLANDSAIAGLIKNIGNVENVKLSSSINRKRRSNYVRNESKPAKKLKTAGVCLHVDQGEVSLEFCAKCASMAAGSADA